MLNNILHTFGIRLITAGISFGVLFLNANFLGAQGLGTVGLIVLNVTLIGILSNLIHGGLIYFSSRKNRGNLLLIAYLWTLISLALYVLVNQIYPLIDSQYLLHTLLLGGIQASASIHHYFLLGKEKIKRFNLISLLQSLGLVGSLLWSFYGRNYIKVDAFIQALYLSYTISYLLALASSANFIEKPILFKLKEDFKDCLNYGFFAQAANTFQLLNYRISYFFLDSLSGRAALGQYTAGVQLSEALLLIGRSISTVQYARISRRKQEAYAKRLSLLLMKVSYLLTTLGLIVLLVIPTDWFVYLLGKDFVLLKQILAGLSIGIIALSAEVILSHYFSGTGRVKTNATSAALGLVVTLVSCYILIPVYGVIGAALSSSASYVAMFIFLYVRMNRRNAKKLSLLLPTQSEVQLLNRIARKFISK